MTAKEIIEKLKKAFVLCDWTDQYGDPIDSDEYYAALDMAIRILEEKEVFSEEDVISRQATIDVLLGDPGSFDWQLEAIKNLPSAGKRLVRCRDCKHYCFAENEIPPVHRFTCDLGELDWEPDSFCSFGEKKESSEK